jgi:hypothetical protein
VSAEIILFIPRPGHDDVQTDFPTIAFRSAAQDPVVDPAEVPSDKHAGPERKES